MFDIYVRAGAKDQKNITVFLAMIKTDASVLLVYVALVIEFAAWQQFSYTLI